MPAALSSSAQLLRSATALQAVAETSRRLAAHAERLPVAASAATADVLLNLQNLTDDMDAAADSLRGQCATCLEGLASMQSLSCPDHAMDELMNRLFSGSCDQDAVVPMVSTMSSADALATSTYLHALIASCRSEGGTECAVSQHAEIDAITPMLTESSRSPSTTIEETSLLRQLSLEGAGTEATFKRCRAPLTVVVATPVVGAGRWMRSTFASK